MGGRAWRLRVETVFTGVELIVLVHYLALAVVWPTQSALIYKKVCIWRLNHSERHLCKDYNNLTGWREDLVQTGASHWMLFTSLAYTVPSALTIFYYGALSDHINRKAAIAIPLFGCIAEYIVGYLSVLFMDELPVSFLLLGAIASGLAGGWPTFFMAIFAYVGTTTDSSRRTGRVGIIEGVFSMSISVALFLSGLMLDKTSFHFIFGFATGVDLMVLTYLFAFVKEPGHNDSKASIKPSSLASIGWTETKDSFLCLTVKRENNRRCQIWVLLLVQFLYMMSVADSWVLSYLYLKRHPLNWTQTLFGYYSGIREVIPGLMVLLVLPWLQRHFLDTTILIAGILSSAASLILFGFTTTTWMAFLVPFVALLTQYPVTAIRSSLSKLVAEHEQGKMFAAFGCLQNVCSVAYHAIYNSIYPLTLSFWPGLCFVGSAVCLILPTILAVWLRFDFAKYSAACYTRIDKSVAEYDGDSPIADSEEDMGDDLEDQKKSILHTSQV